MFKYSNGNYNSSFSIHYDCCSTPWYKVQYYDDNGNMIERTTSTTSEKILLASMIPKTKFVPMTEERIEEYIQDNYDKYNIQEYGSYIYQMIQEKAYDFASEITEEAKEEYTIVGDENDIIEAIIKEIDFDSLYELLEDILHAPITIEDKLSDIGMSNRDFL